MGYLDVRRKIYEFCRGGALGVGMVAAGSLHNLKYNLILYPVEAVWIGVGFLVIFEICKS